MNVELVPTAEYNAGAWARSRSVKVEQVPASEVVAQKKLAERISGWYQRLTGHNSGFLGWFNSLRADLDDRVCGGLPYVLKTSFDDDTAEEKENADQSAVLMDPQIEQTRLSAVNNIAAVLRALASYGVLETGKARGHPMSGSLLAYDNSVMGKRPTEEQGPVLRHVLGTVEEVTASDVIVNVVDEGIGWYSLCVPCAQFLDRPEPRSKVTVDVWFEPGKGVTNIHVPAGTRAVRPTAGVEAPRRPATPKVPDDFDDPAQAAEFERKLREDFRLA